MLNAIGADRAESRTSLKMKLRLFLERLSLLGHDDPNLCFSSSVEGTLNRDVLLTKELGARAPCRSRRLLDQVP
jgi:hypothetical protein